MENFGYIWWGILIFGCGSVGAVVLWFLFTLVFGKDKARVGWNRAAVDPAKLRAVKFIDRN